MSFIQTVVETTKNSQTVRAEYDRVSNVLYNIVDRRVKKEVLARAEDGYTNATIDLLNDISVDINSRWSIHELLFGNVFQDAAPVVDRLFRGEPSSFEGFDISGQAHVISLDWTMAMLGQTPPQPPAPNALKTPAHSPPNTPREPAQSPPDTPRASRPFTRNIFCDELSEKTQEEMLAYLASLLSPTIVKRTEKK